MDISFDSSRRNFDKNNSILSPSYEVGTTLSETSSLMEFNLISNIHSIINGFKNITKLFSENSDYLTMINEYRNILDSHDISKKLNMLNKFDDSELSSSVFIICNEIKTWKLISLLYKDRFLHKSNIQSNEILAKDTLCSELDVLKRLFDSNKNLREAQIVIEWLELFFQEKLSHNTEFLIGSHGKSWEHTKYVINKRDIFSRKKQYELDPDAPFRGRLNLMESDKENESEYLRYLFHCVQSGDIEKAQLVCNSHDEFWRGSTLNGWMPLRNPLMNSVNLEMNNIDIYGNPNRNLFKHACQKLSENTQLNLYERAIYAVFCGNLQVLSMVEKDWNGLLWAHFKVHIESMIDYYLKTYTNNGAFHTQSLFGDDDIDLSRFPALKNLETSSITSINENLSVYDWKLEQIFNSISLKLAHDPIDVLQGGNRISNCTTPSKLFYQSVFEMVQKFIILEDIEGIVEQIAFVISRFSEKKSVSDKNIMRFLTHLIIFIYSTHENLKIEVYHKVLEEYIKCLIDDKYLDTVAFYISKLSMNLQIKWFSKSLLGINTYKEKQNCIEDALNYDLPIVEITRYFVRTIRMNQTESEIFPSSSTAIADVNFEEKNRFEVLVSDIDRVKIDCLDWLTFLPEQKYHLIRQANAFSRTFLEAGKLHAAKMIMNKISDDIWCQLNINKDKGPLWLPNALYENECLRKYIACHDLYGDWFNHFTCHKPLELDLTVNPDLNKLSFQEKQLLQKQHDEYILSLQQWKTLLNFYANKAYESFVDLLKMGTRGWLSDTGDDSLWSNESNDAESNNESDNDHYYNRKQQIELLRKNCIVTVAFMALKVLSNSGENEKCFDLVNLLADSRYELFSAFDKKHLQSFLCKVRQSSLVLMSEGKDALGIRF